MSDPSGTILSAKQRKQILRTNKRLRLARIEIEAEGDGARAILFDPPYLLEPWIDYAIFMTATGNPELWQIRHVDEIDEWAWARHAERTHYCEPAGVTRH